MNKNFQSTGNASEGITFNNIITRLEAFTLENINTPLVQDAIKKAQEELTIKNLKESKNDSSTNRRIR